MSSIKIILAEEAPNLAGIFCPVIIKHWTVILESDNPKGWITSVRSRVAGPRSLVTKWYREASGLVAGG